MLESFTTGSLSVSGFCGVPRTSSSSSNVLPTEQVHVCSCHGFKDSFQANSCDGVTAIEGNWSMLKTEDGMKLSFPLDDERIVAFGPNSENMHFITVNPGVIFCTLAFPYPP
jgi:hypothetical protein